MKAIAKEHEIPIIEDLGSGALVDLSRYGISHEPMVQEAICGGADVVCFSGDKLLGGPQAGIIAGRKCYIDKMKKAPLTRALRVDKFTTAALEMTLEEYLSEERAMQKIPVLKMISEMPDTVRQRAQKLKSQLEQQKLPAQIVLEACESQIGGGALPLEKISSTAVAIRSEICSASEMEKRMRALSTPIIGRMINGVWAMDMRTIEEEKIPYIVDCIQNVLNSCRI